MYTWIVCSWILWLFENWLLFFLTGRPHAKKCFNKFLLKWIAHACILSKYQSSCHELCLACAIFKGVNRWRIILIKFLTGLVDMKSAYYGHICIYLGYQSFGPITYCCGVSSVVVQHLLAARFRNLREIFFPVLQY